MYFVDFFFLSFSWDTGYRSVLAGREDTLLVLDHREIREQSPDHLRLHRDPCTQHVRPHLMRCTELQRKQMNG